MVVRINRKICDNIVACGGVKVCPTGAIFWDVEKQTPVTDDSKCINCGQCEDACPLGAILWAVDEQALKRIEADIIADERILESSIVERYGAKLVDESAQIENAVIDMFVEANVGVVFIEQNKKSTIACLLQSISITQLQTKLGTSFTYKKAFIDEDQAGVFPRLLVYVNAKKVGVVDGYYGNTQTDEFVKKIGVIVKST
ncbi:MAG: 4Fe-4S binding protein [Nitrososphaerota archaeon]|jgi:Fe-S-cluster-containing hydrogenase component 2|nr:4Fe-4S binding protein [Nitrososphaerota archaeon]